ncbi:DUF3089 domain-containing protein [Ferruginibacter lapsinanis]|uniref:DUF3089 domain-containing protein n=1 Tax=Ferruginibacter lapsinanis TaxID=563172 RepID=UPI001E54AF56|nr:DUF3089 domain-containing protein [Ferruginibacter lapsinanis]UEG50741.1 DUF3089 domain-containing protein [Ferruginibacter lapsinanis]
MALLIVSSCSKKNYSNRPEYKFSSIDGKPDYSNLSYWAAHPWKWDPSDSISASLQKNYSKDSAVDVFFIYPTTLVDYSDTSWNASIDNAEINSKTDYSTILYQASVFSEKCRVFSPRYRQAHLKAFFSDDTAMVNKAFAFAYEDIKNAFDFYMKTWNNGRPIIIASHSQGTVHAAKLLKEYFEGKELQKNLVCAYLIGMPIHEKYFESLNPCHDSLSTGCFVSWRTFKNGYIEPKYIAKEKLKSIVVNPLTWNSSEEFAPRKMNGGGILKNYNKIVPGVVNAQIHQNILWCSKPRFFGNIFFTKKNYHIGDINLFYNNIRQNIQTRILSFQKQHN